MTKKQKPLSVILAAAEFPDSGEPPQDIMVFPKPGLVEALDGRVFHFGNYQTLINEFKKAGKKLPIDINHSEAHRSPVGEESPL